MKWSRFIVERPSKIGLSCVFLLACASASCGAPDSAGGSFMDPGPECLTADDCKDADACTADECIDGACVHSDVKPDDGNVCTIDNCDPQTGVSHKDVLIDDGDACTVDACDPMLGTSHTPINPSDGDACTEDSCDPKTGPVHTPIATDDGDLCTIDACDSSTGAVSHTPKDVDDSDVCTIDTCDPATGAEAHTPISIDDGNACTADACDPAAGVSHTPNPPCKQQIAESCNFVLCDPADGVCKPKDAAFSDDFADNSAGWDLDMEWSIGPAKASSGQTQGNPDPAQDYDGSANADNGVAGVAIGGNATSTGGATYYLTSPEVDLSSLPASETVYLDFWRYLNSAAPATMKSNIEVWNGTTWVQIWVNPAAVFDPVWSNLTYDVTSYKGAHFRVRFGVNFGGPSPAVSSWNIDHVRLIRHIDTGC